MKSIKTKFAVILLVAALALTGCMDMKIGVSINSDGSAKISTIVNIDREKYLNGTKQFVKDIGAKLTKKDIKELDTALTEEGYKLVTIDGKEFYQYKTTENVAKGQVQNYFAQGMKSSYVTEDIFFVSFMPADTQMGQGMSIKDIQDAAKQQGGDVPEGTITFEMAIEFANPIVSTNGKIDPSNPKRATFDISMDYANTLFATTRSGLTVNMIKEQVKKLNAVNAPKIKKLKADKVSPNAKTATATLKIKKVKVAKKYQIQYSTKKNFKKSTVKSTKNLTYKLKGLKKGTKYYVRVRAAKKNYAGVFVYSKWTKKTVKTNK